MNVRVAALLPGLGVAASTIGADDYNAIFERAVDSIDFDFEFVGVE